MGKPHPKPKLTDKAIARFHSKYERGGADECWAWRACYNGRGYGSFYADGRNYRAPRIAYLIATSEYPGEKLVCHACDNRSCVNPAHLWLGTAADNMRDMAKKGRGGRVGPDGTWIAHAKLNAGAVLAIRAARGTEAAVKLAKRYGVGRTTIYDVWRGISWTHVRAAESAAL